MPKGKCQVFSPYEKEVLLELIEQRSNILENKGNNATNISKKDDAWKEVHAEFNSRQGVTQRTEKQLRDLWKNIKARSKGDVANYRRSLITTGGGREAQKPDVLTTRVCNILPQQMQSLSNPFDDDAAFHLDEGNKEELDDVNQLGGPSGEVKKDQLQDSEEIAGTSTSATGQSSTSARTSTSVGKNLVSGDGSLSSGVGNSTMQSMIKANYYAKKKEKNMEASRKSTECKQRITDLAEIEHNKKMEYLKIEHEKKMEILNLDLKRKAEIYELKEEVLRLKKAKLQQGTVTKENSTDEDENVVSKQACDKLWHPF